VEIHHDAKTPIRQTTFDYDTFSAAMLRKGRLRPAGFDDQILDKPIDRVNRPPVQPSLGAEAAQSQGRTFDLARATDDSGALLMSTQYEAYVQAAADVWGGRVQRNQAIAATK
jgi:hypothetical protein